MSSEVMLLQQQNSLATGGSHTLLKYNSGQAEVTLLHDYTTFAGIT